MLADRHGALRLEENVVGRLTDPPLAEVALVGPAYQTASLAATRRLVMDFAPRVGGPLMPLAGT